MKKVNEAFNSEESKKIYDNFLAIVNDSKRRDKLVKKHGSNAEAVAYGTAVNQVKKQSNSRKDKEEKLREMIQNSLSQPITEKKCKSKLEELVDTVMKKLKENR
jgi:hypothetical protein